MKVLLEGYRVASVLGRGAASTVYHVVETATGKDMALKRVIRNTKDDDKFIEQAENEFTATHRISHPYIRHSFEIHRHREWLKLKELLLLMEYVDGHSLEARRPSRLDTFLGIFKRVAEGLQAVHGAGLLHADLKPQNVLWTRKGIVKVIDFGQSGLIGERKNRVQGTPDFIAPEQVKKGVLDQRTDIFNLGATMYWVLTRRFFPTDLPFQQPNDGRSAHHVHVPRVALTPRQINPKIPLALSQLVMECCRALPADRPPDMDVVRRRLASIQALWRKGRNAAKEKRHVADDKNRGSAVE